MKGRPMSPCPPLSRDVFAAALRSAGAELKGRLAPLTKLERARTVIIYTYGAKGKELALMLRNRGVACLIYDNSEQARQRAAADDFTITRTLDLDFPLIVAAGQNQVEILSRLQRAAISLAEALYVFDLSHAYAPARAFTDAIEEDLEALFEIYARLDPTSAAAFLEVLEYRASLNACRLTRQRPVGEMWIPPIENLDVRSFCDIGAYNGDSLLTVHSAFPSLTRSFTVEPNPDLGPAIAATAARLGVANTPYTGVAWSHRTRLQARELPSGMYVIEESVNGEIPAEALDILLQDIAYDYIKMDVEGTERAVLDGAAKSLSRASCVAVAGYHLPHDLIDLPAQIQALLGSALDRKDPEGWRLSFAHYSQVFDDSILYAWKQPTPKLLRD
jgi:FkbM family methyltransferase